MHHVKLTSVVVLQVILAPIVEPPSQTGITTGFYETPLYATLSEAFGYMNDAGYCSTGGVCKNFPLLLEIGSPLTSLDDQLMMESLANYMTLSGLGKLPAINSACISKSQQRQHSHCILWHTDSCFVASLTGMGACTWSHAHQGSSTHACSICTLWH